MGQTTDINKEFIQKYKVDNVILKSFFKDQNNKSVDTSCVFPLRIDNRQLCSPTDYQGKKPSCCGYSAAQILEALNWRDTGKLVQFDADQIYAKAKETDKEIGKAGTYPDLAMTKGLDLAHDLKTKYVVKSIKTYEINDLKRIIHKNMFACINMVVTEDIYKLDGNDFVYRGIRNKVGGHSLVCCGYDDQSKMLIVQNHWGTIWGAKGFFLCSYDAWQRQCNLTCWYERI